MRYIADLHTHSKYARACSKELTPENIDLWCRIKGIDIIATGDFTHPKWFAELSEKLEPAEEGLYRLKKKFQKTQPQFKEKSPRDVRFVCGTELSCIYKKGDATRRLHLLVFAPSLEVVKKINDELERRDCNISSDGRPIIGLHAEELLQMLLDIDERNILIPAHAWTPWFAVFGSKSGFDTIEECFGNLSKHIFAIETGLSSDPPMNWRVSGLDNVALISNSDAHSLPNLGREANVFEGDKISYDLLFDGIRSASPNARCGKKKSLLTLVKTIEFFPDEGKYHYDGHAECKISLHPKDAIKKKNMCPVCGRELTIGVLHRVEELADRTEEQKPASVVPFVHSVELEKIIADSMGVKGRSSKKVKPIYWDIIERTGGELPFLLDVKSDQLSIIASETVAAGVRRIREGKIKTIPGYDGVYGIVQIFDDSEKVKKQKTLFGG